MIEDKIVPFPARPALASAEEAAMLAAARNPRAMLRMLRFDLSHLVYELVEISVGRIEETYDERGIIGRIVALRPLLQATVQRFFALSDSQRHTLLDRARRNAEAVERDEEIDPNEDVAPSQGGAFDNARNATFDTLNATIRNLPAAEWQQLTLSAVSTPERAVWDMIAMQGLLSLIAATIAGDPPLSDAERDLVDRVLNPPGCDHILPVLRDLSRGLR